MADRAPERSVVRLLDTLMVFFAALAVALRPLVPAQGTGTDPELWVPMCVVLAAMCWLVRMALEQRLRLARTGVGWPMAALLAVAAVSTLRSPHKAASVTVLLDWACYAVAFALLANLAAGRLERRFVLRLLWASAFAVCLYGLFQQFVNLPLLREQILSDPERVMRELPYLRPKDYDDLAARAGGRIFATFLLPNSFAGFLVLVVPGFVGHVLDRLGAGERGRGFLAVAGAWVVVACGCLLFTYSKGGWIAFAAAGVFCVLLGRGVLRRHWRWVAAAAGGGLAAVVALFAAGVIPLRIFRDAVGSMGVRVGYWRTAWAMARDHWLAGVGLGTFASHYNTHR
ncbi:MAG: O-antigen ligase family protein, partial [bacterium]